MELIKTSELDAWTFVNEQNIFLLQDGLQHLTDLILSPLATAPCSSFSEYEYGTSCAEISKRLVQSCSLKQGSYYLFFKYRQNALKSLWLAQKHHKKRRKKERNSRDEIKKVQNVQGQTFHGAEVPFSSHVSLLLLLPLLHSQSRIDPNLADHSVEILLQCLRNCSPHSLRNEPTSCIKGLQGLLCNWLQGEDAANVNPGTRESAMASLVALGCGTFSIKVFIEALHVLDQAKKETLRPLPIGDIIKKAKQYERTGQHTRPTLLLTSLHVSSWKFQDFDGFSCSSKYVSKCHSLACDERFLYLKNFQNKGILKIGSGKHGTLRGFPYARNLDLDDGWVACAQDVVLFRPQEFDKFPNNFCMLLDPLSLRLLQTLTVSTPGGVGEKGCEQKGDGQNEQSNLKTVQFISDGTHLYWLWYENKLVLPQDDQGLGHQKPFFNLYLQEFTFDGNLAVACGLPVVVTRKEEELPQGIASPLGRRSPTTVAPREPEEMTSSGLSVNTLQQIAMFTNSDTLVMVLPHHLVPSVALPPRTSRSAVNLCFSTLDGSYLGQENIVDTTNGSGHDLIVTGLGACYDNTNDLLWTCSSNLISEWRNMGYPSFGRVRRQLGINSNLTEFADSNSCNSSVTQVQFSVAEQIVFLCRTLQSSLYTMHNIQPDPDLVLDSSDVKQICEVIEASVKRNDLPAVLCLLIALQLLLTLASLWETPLSKDKDVLDQTKSLAWKLLCAHTNVIGARIQEEACRVLLSGRRLFYASTVEQSALLTVLLGETDDTTGLIVFRNLLLMELADELGCSSSPGVTVKRSERLAQDTVLSLLKLCIKEAKDMIALCSTAHHSELQKSIEICSIVSPAMQYLVVLITTTWKELMLAEDYNPDSSTEVISGSIMERVEIEVLSCELMDACQEVFQMYLEVLGKLASVLEQRENIQFRLEMLDRCVSTTMLGQLLPLIVTVMDDEKFCHLPVAKTALSTVTSLTVIATRAANLYCRLKVQSQNVKDDQQTEGSKSNKDVPISNLSIPCPWSNPRTVESIHPVRDDYKLCKTVKLPGAKCLYLRFDPRCATQYEYDKVTVYLGDTSSGRKVAEFGGNTYGIGGRSVVRLGWPKDVLKVDSDTVTISFQVKSTRERGTPDKAVWGFACIVSATDTAEKPSELPLLVDIAFSLSVLSYSFMNVLYQGPLTTAAEQACQHLLKSKLLQKCVWPNKADVSVPSSACVIKFKITPEATPNVSSPAVVNCQKVTRTKLTCETIQSLREIAYSVAPTLRPSIKEALKLEEIEEVILSAVIKHLCMENLIDRLPLLQAKETENEDCMFLFMVMQEAFRRLNTLIRQLQAMADMEQQWSREVEEINLGRLQPSSAFFNEYHLQESKTKDLELLCNLHRIDFDPVEQEEAVGKLIQCLEEESKKTKDDSVTETVPATKAFLWSIIECAELLCNVTIKSKLTKERPERSVSHEAFTLDSVQPTDCEKEREASNSPGFMRSMSAPPHLQRAMEEVQEGIQDVLRLQRWRTAVQRKNVIEGMSREDEGPDDMKQTFYLNLDEIFTFIGSDPEKTVTCSQFLEAAAVRNERGAYRVQCLQHMKELVAECSRVEGQVPHLLKIVASILVQGTRTEELECGGMVSEVRDEFSSVVQAVVQFAATSLTVYSDSILLVSVSPFTWYEEHCLVRSGLVSVLDQLCALRRSRAQQGKMLALQAWAGFQTLINGCVQWEQEKGYCARNIEWSGLAYQISTLLTNYLSCVLDESRKTHSGVNDPLRYVLDLLRNIAKSKMGEAILSEPCMVSTLLAQLIGRHTPPRLVLTVVKLLRTALPLMSAESSQNLSLPAAANQFLGSDYGQNQHLGPVLKVAKLLLGKLGDYILPSPDRDSNSVSEEDVRLNPLEEQADWESSNQQDDVVSLYVHKHEGQLTHEIVQRIFSMDGAPFIFVIGQGSDMERAARIDQELTDHGYAEVQTDHLTACIRKAHELAQCGLVVSIGPTGQLANDMKSSHTDEKEQDPLNLCKLRNTKLSSSDASHPFICGQAAQTMASEVIALLRSLLSTASSDISKLWTAAVYQVLCDALKYVPNLIDALEYEIESNNVEEPVEETAEGSEERFDLEGDEWLAMARQVVATLCVLGGFKQRVRPGCNAQVVGEGMAPVVAEVLSVSERQGMATVLLWNGSEKYSGRAQDVPLVRLQIQDDKVSPLRDSSIVNNAVDALHHLLAVKDPYAKSSVQCSAAARVLAEIKSRASLTVLCLVKDPLMVRKLANEPSKLVPLLRKLGAECDPGDRLDVSEAHCYELRKLFKEFVKPSDLTIRQSTSKRMVLDLYRRFPPVCGCLFTEGQMCIHFMTDPTPTSRNASPSLPRGTFVYANARIPIKAPSFYWEIEVVSLGNVEEHTAGPTLSVGFAPGAQTSNSGSGWVNPIGTCFLHSNGRAVLYRSGGLLQWKTISLNINMKEEDIVGCGYERDVRGEAAYDDADKGKVYFTYNGRRLSESLNGVEAGLWPALHIQQKNVRIRVNFGSRPFAYAAGHRHRAAAELANDPSEELKLIFEMMPFAFDFDDEESELSSIPQPSSADNLPGTSAEDASSPQGSSNQEYSPTASLQYKLSSSCDHMTDTGPIRSLMADDRGSSNNFDPSSEEPHKLLIKAWENRVFPVIRRRFRNDSDRQSGLEQIRGALMAGMMDIAVATVSDLYDDNGGIPSTLQLPKLEDVKADANKMAMNNIRKGMTVVVNSFPEQDSLPGFAVAEMRKTFGLVGIVQGIDMKQELVEVETYNREEGTLLRYWYPVSVLQRPNSTPVHRRAISVVSGFDEALKQDVLAELLKCESTVCRMYCRLAMTELISIKGLAGEPVFKDTEYEVIQYLSGNLLLGPQADGDIRHSSSLLSPGPRYCLRLNSLQPSEMFYREPELLCEAIRHALSVAALEGESEMKSLINTFCNILNDPRLVMNQKIPLNFSKVDAHVHFQNAAMMVVSFNEDVNNLNTGSGSHTTKNASTVIYCYYGGNKLTKSGQLARYKVISYPNTDHTVDGNGTINKGEKYPQKILPCNRLYVRSDVLPTENLSLLFHGFPSEFFLCLVFIEVFIAYSAEVLTVPKVTSQISGTKTFTARDSKRMIVQREELDRGDRRKFSPVTKVKNLDYTEDKNYHRSLVHVADLLSSFLQKTDLPPVVMEIIFHLLAQLLRLSMLSQRIHLSSSGPFSSILKRLSPLCTELSKVLEKEISLTNTTALNFVLNCNFEKDKFTSYLQALFELVLAMAELSHCPSLPRLGSFEEQKKMHECQEADGENAQVESCASQIETDGSFSHMAALPDISIGEELPAGPVMFTAPPVALNQAQSSRRQRMRNKRGSGRRKKPRFTPEVASPTETMPWFEEVLNTTLILRNMLYGDRSGEDPTRKILSSVVLAKSNVFQRILIITNIPRTLDRKTAIQALKKACRPSGGICEGEIYLPEVPKEQAKTVNHDCEVKMIKNVRADRTGEVHGNEQVASSGLRDHREKIVGYGLLELRSGHQVELARQAIMASKILNTNQISRSPADVSEVGVAKVNHDLLVEGTNELEAFGILDDFLKKKIFQEGTEKCLSTPAKNALTEIFTSCVITALRHSNLVGGSSSSENLRTLSDTNLCSTSKGSGNNEPETCGTKEELLDTLGKDQSSVKVEASTTTSKTNDGLICKQQTEKTTCLLTKEQVLTIFPGNNLLKFFNAVKNAKESSYEIVSQLVQAPCSQEGDTGSSEEETLSLKVFLDWVIRRGTLDVRCIWKGLLACGYNIRFERCTLLFPWEVEQDHATWTMEKDSALVRYVDSLCQSLSTSPSCLVPDEVNILESDLANQIFVPLQGIPLLSIRTRFAFLKVLNQTLERLVLPVTDLRLNSPYYLSTAALLKDASCIMFYDNKVGFLNHLLDNSAHRKSEQSSPEISLDPLESLEANKVSSAGPQFCQVANQLSNISSCGLRVKVATGGDPIFPLKVHLRGEQVLGSGGSFRHFMWHMARELQGPHLGLLIPCPSSAANKNKGKFILKPGLMTYPEEKWLIFFGQLLGIALRSDIPLALDLMPVFWKSLLGLPLDPTVDLQETDILTYNYIRRFSQVATREEFSTLCNEADLCPYKFVYTSLDGQEVELIPNGANTSVTWENHDAYVEAIRDFRLRELRCEARMSCIQCGLSSVIPLPQALCVMRPSDMEIRTCATPTLDLDFLKAHTTYVAGVKDTDRHIEYFWAAMEGFSQDQLKKFVKFACNQERLPSRCTCQDSASMVDVHVPPYPMKIGPPDGRGPPDARYIRVETCMFMVKLPQYSSQEIMTQRLLYAINCREDPLTDR